MQNARMDSLKAEIAATAARMVVEEGLEYGPAKRRAVKHMGLSARASLPDNAAVEDAVREYLALFCADTQPGELAALRRLAALWMARLAPFRPYLVGAVWRGTATRLSDIHLHLFCDDSKAVDIALIDQHLRYTANPVNSFRGEPTQVLSLSVRAAELGEAIGLHLTLHDYDDLRHAPGLDAQGRSQRGDLQALTHLLQLQQKDPTHAPA